MKGVANFSKEAISSTEGYKDGLDEGEAGDVVQMWYMDSLKLIRKVDCSGKPILVG